MQNHLENKAYAGFFVRLAAFAVDSLIAAFAVGIVKLPFAIAAMGGVRFLTVNFIFDYTFLDVFTYIGVAAYFVLITYFCHSTPGKLLFRLEVVTKSGEWTFLNILYRETIGRFLSSLLCIGYLTILAQKEKQGFHDMLCDTYVVYKNMVPNQSACQHPAMAVAGNAGEAPFSSEAAALNASDAEGFVQKEVVQPPSYHTPSAFIMEDAVQTEETKAPEETD